MCSSLLSMGRMETVEGMFMFCEPAAELQTSPTHYFAIFEEKHRFNKPKWSIVLCKLSHFSCEVPNVVHIQHGFKSVRLFTQRWCFLFNNKDLTSRANILNINKCRQWQTTHCCLENPRIWAWTPTGRWEARSDDLTGGQCGFHASLSKAETNCVPAFSHLEMTTRSAAWGEVSYATALLLCITMSSTSCWKLCAAF